MGAKFSKSEIREAVRRVITYYLRKRELGLERRKELFLVPRFPVGFQELLAEFELYGELESVDFLLAEEGLEALNITGCRLFYIYDKRDVSYILNGLTAYEKVEIYDPSLDMLRALKEGRETDLFSKISIYFLLSEKPVIVRLPYDIHSARQGAFGRITRELKEDLQDMGISFPGLLPGFGEFLPAGEGGTLTLVTEDEVERAYQRGERLIRAAKAAVITPLAADKARERGVTIIRE